MSTALTVVFIATILALVLWSLFRFTSISENRRKSQAELAQMRAEMYAEMARARRKKEEDKKAETRGETSDIKPDSEAEERRTSTEERSMPT